MHSLMVGTGDTLHYYTSRSRLSISLLSSVSKQPCLLPMCSAVAATQNDGCDVVWCDDAIWFAHHKNGLKEYEWPKGKKSEHRAIFLYLILCRRSLRHHHQRRPGQRRSS